MHLPDGILCIWAALRGRTLTDGEWLAIGKMLRIPRIALLSFRWRAWRDPHDIEAWFKAAHIHRHVYGERDRALAFYEGGLGANPDSVDLWKAKGDLLADAGRYGEAQEAYDRAVALTDEKVPLLMEKSRLFLEGQNRPEQALAAVDRAIALSPVSPPILAWKRLILLHLGKKDQADAVNDRILEIDPRNGDALLHRARALRETGKGDLALGVYDAYLFHYPGSGDIWRSRAGLLLELHRYPDALESVEKALLFGPGPEKRDRSLAEELRGDILVRLRRHGDAIAAYERVLSQDPGRDSAVIREKMAGALFALGDYPATVAACDRAIALSGQERRDISEIQNLRDAAQKRIRGT